MKKFLILFVILVFPTAFYIFLSFGVTRFRRAPVFGPREAVEITDKDGNKKNDTAYFTIPAFTAPRAEGGDFSSAQYKGRMYVAAFLDPDSSHNAWNVGPLLTDYKIHSKEYWNVSFLFFWPVDSPAIRHPDMAAELQMSKDSAVTLLLPRARFDSLRTATYFIADPARKKEPFTQKMYDLVFVDTKGRIRGYYNGRYLGKVKELKEDIGHVYQNDEAVETSARLKIEKKEK